MNEINISEERFNSSQLLSTSGHEIELRKVGHITYGICTRSDRKLHFAFSSSELTAYLATRKSKTIIDVKLLQQNPVVGDEIDQTMILRLKFSDARVTFLDKYDHIYEFDPIIASEVSTSLTSPNKQWGLPALSIAGLMLFTERMVRTVEDIADDGQHGYLVKVLWEDYRLAVDSSGADEFDQITIEGEFMSYTVKRFAHGLYIFDSAHEV